jgi:hypothetical protein
MPKPIPVLLIGGKFDGMRTVAESSPLFIEECKLPRFSEDFAVGQPSVKVETYSIHSLATGFIGVHQGLTKDEAIARLISRYPKKRKRKTASWKKSQKVQWAPLPKHSP